MPSTRTWHAGSAARSPTICWRRPSRGRFGTADDLLAETFARAFRHRRRYDLGRQDAGPWLYGIATNVVREHRRAEARRLRTLARAAPAVEADPVSDAVEDRLAARAARRQLARALSRLPAGHRDVVLLFAWAQLDYQEIADALNVPAGTVRSRLHRAREALRAAIPAHARHESEGER
jgi:RNA polymerase sigma factor (sigma-70 family)